MSCILLVNSSEECDFFVKKSFATTALQFNIVRRLCDAKSAIASSDQIDLILLNPALPDGDGLVLLDLLKQNDRYQNTQVILLKSSTDRKPTDVLKKGNLMIWTKHMRASIRNGDVEEAVSLTGKEFKILCFLAGNEGQVYSRAELIQSVWGKSIKVLDRTVDTHVYVLRKKLKSFAHYIESVPGVGYRFMASG